MNTQEMKLIGSIKGADIFFDADNNLFFCDPDNSEGLYFDEQDLSEFSEDVANQIKDLIG